MKMPRAVAWVVAVAFLSLPNTPAASPSIAPIGGASWICFAYGALAGAALMTGSLVGALSLGLGAARAGCFG